MLKQLNVQNFALIHQATLNFNDGYTVITGETGSGKSILLNALQLILGERADFKVIGTNHDKAIVEGVFKLNKERFLSFFTDNDIDFEVETIIRREITKQGKSRAFINDTPVSLSLLKELVEQLVSIHSQYNTLELKRKDFQFKTLDLLAGTFDKHQTYLEKYEALKSLSKEIEETKELLIQLTKDKDYIDFQLEELEELAIENTDFDQLETQLSRIENASEIQQLSQAIANGLSNDSGIIEQLQTIKAYLQKLVRLDTTTQTLEERIQSIIVELKDVGEELDSFSSNYESFNEENRHQLTNLLDKYNHVLTKHRCSSQEELKQLYLQLKNSSANTDALQQKIEQLENQYKIAHSTLQDLANQLTVERQKAIPIIESTISKSLSELKLSDTQLKFDLKVNDELTMYGNSTLSLLFSANKGFSPIEIEKAASGGELSRVMLALQQLISEKMQLPTIFFDEIDTGVSGDVAQKIGNLLQQMGKTMQLFAISHLPQVASKANYHLKVEKKNNNNSTQTSIQLLTNDERINEVARLMSGEIITDAAISNAKALMA
ncbi:MAG: DNA repair protein RecN [Crocinitomicaceae bacterium]|nr:DNA repair protein RecN [Crocinitomicaceae bacterium]